MVDCVPVTGGELSSLWYVASIDLPTTENVYIEQMNIVHDVDGEVDTKKYGPCHSSWVAVASDLEQAMYGTVASMRTATLAVYQAVHDYASVDGDAAKGLTQAGRELLDTIRSEIKADPTLGPVPRKDLGDAATPNVTGDGLHMVASWFTAGIANSDNDPEETE